VDGSEKVPEILNKYHFFALPKGQNEPKIKIFKQPIVIKFIERHHKFSLGTSFNDI